MNLNLSKEEFDVVANALEAAREKYEEKLNEMYQHPQFYFEKGEKDLKEAISNINKVYNSKIQPVVDEELDKEK